MEVSTIIAGLIGAMLSLGASLVVHFVRRSGATRDLASELRVSVAVIDTSLAEFRRSVDTKLLRLDERVADLPCNDCNPTFTPRKAVNE